MPRYIPMQWRVPGENITEIVSHASRLQMLVFIVRWTPIPTLVIATLAIATLAIALAIAIATLALALALALPLELVTVQMTPSQMDKANVSHSGPPMRCLSLQPQAW